MLNRLAIGGPAMNTLALASELSTQYEILLIAGQALPHEHTAEHLLKNYTGFKVQIIREFTRNVFLWKDHKAYRILKSIIQEFNPQIVHTHGSKPGVLGRWAAYRLKVPVIIHTYHGHVFHSYFSPIISKLIVWLERRLATYTDIIIAINKQLLNDLTTVYKITDPSSILLSPLGLDLAYYQQAAVHQTRNEVRAMLGLKNEDLAVVAIGRLVPVKQHSLFVRIAARFVKEHPSIPFKFLIVGDGPERDHLKLLAENEGLKYSVGAEIKGESNLVFLLWRTDIPAILSAMEILLHTSLNEGTPVSILEAMAMGKPVVATAVGGIPELLNALGAGMVCDNEKELMENLLQLAGNSELSQSLGKKGKQFVENHMSISKQAAMLVERINAISI